MKKLLNKKSLGCFKNNLIYKSAKVGMLSENLANFPILKMGNLAGNSLFQVFRLCLRSPKVSFY